MPSRVSSSIAVLVDGDEVLMAVCAAVSLMDRLTLAPWLDGQVGFSVSTGWTYESRLRNCLTLHLGAVPLDGLRVPQAGAMFTSSPPGPCLRSLTT